MLTALFCIVAVIYSMVGFGGGSSYIALLYLFDIPFQLIPPIALLCNIVVVTGGAVNFIRNGHFHWKLFWPFVVTSVPLAFIGGAIPISREVFMALLGVCLFGAGLRLLLLKTPKQSSKIRTFHWAAGLGIGGLLGLLSGMVGIGGGIFLAPILLILNWGRPKQVAATASLFILVNSLAGLAGQLVKADEVSSFEIVNYWPLFLAVFVGGLAGSLLGAGQLSEGWIRKATAGLVLFVGGRILFPLVFKLILPII